MKRKSTRRLAAVAALAACALTVGPLTSQASALVPTKVVAHSTVLDLETASLHATVPLRPSANAYRKDTGAPIAGKFVQFFARGIGLCVDKTNANGYAQCEGLVRLTHSTLGLGKYLAVFPKQGKFAQSQDNGQLLTLSP